MGNDKELEKKIKDLQKENKKFKDDKKFVENVKSAKHTVMRLIISLVLSAVLSLTYSRIPLIQNWFDTNCMLFGYSIGYGVYYIIIFGITLGISYLL